jgi:hypothetical protein
VITTDNVSAGQLSASRWSSTANLTAGTPEGSTPANWPVLGSTTYWDALYDVGTGKVWVYGESTTTATSYLRRGIAVGSGVVWDAAATADDTAVGGAAARLPQTIMCVKHMVSTYGDWQVLDNNSGSGQKYVLLGDYTIYQAPPLGPTLTAPANNAYADLAGTPTFSWTYNSQVLGNTQTGWALRRKIGAGAYSWWNDTTPGWQGTEVFNLTAVGSKTFVAASWVDGNTYNWSVANQDQGGTGPYSADFVVNADQTPTVAVTGPTGTQVTQMPVVTWTEVLGTLAGTVQSQYRVVVYTAAQYGASGFTPGTSPPPCPPPWPTTQRSGLTFKSPRPGARPRRGSSVPLPSDWTPPLSRCLPVATTRPTPAPSSTFSAGTTC